MATAHGPIIESSVLSGNRARTRSVVKTVFDLPSGDPYQENGRVGKTSAVAFTFIIIFFFFVEIPVLRFDFYGRLKCVG